MPQAAMWPRVSAKTDRNRSTSSDCSLCGGTARRFFDCLYGGSRSGYAGCCTLFSPRTCDRGLDYACGPVQSCCMTAYCLSEAVARRFRFYPEIASYRGARQEALLAAVARDIRRQGMSEKGTKGESPAEGGNPAERASPASGHPPDDHKLGVAVSTVQGWKMRDRSAGAAGADRRLRKNSERTRCLELEAATSGVPRSLSLRRLRPR